MMSFTHEFTEAEDVIYFSYSFPYSFSSLHSFLNNQKEASRMMKLDYMKEGILCKSLGGLEVPMITISSRLLSDSSNYHEIKLDEF